MEILNTAIQQKSAVDGSSVEDEESETTTESVIRDEDNENEIQLLEPESEQSGLQHRNRLHVGLETSTEQ